MARVFWVVMSPMRVTQPLTGFMGTRSTPILMLATGMYLVAT